MSDKNIPFLGSFLLTALLLTIIILTQFFYHPVTNFPPPGTPVPTQALQKIERGSKHPPYSTNPPSSGWYTESNLRTGIFTNPVSDEQIVEALTKGTVVISFNCQYKAVLPTNIPRLAEVEEEATSSQEISENNISDEPKKQTRQEGLAIIAQIREQNQVCGDLTSGLRKIVERLGEDGLILTPNPKLDNRIALVSWGVIDKFFFMDEERIIKFIQFYRGKKPTI